MQNLWKSYKERLDKEKIAATLHDWLSRSVLGIFRDPKPQGAWMGLVIELCNHWEIPAFQISRRNRADRVPPRMDRSQVMRTFRRRSVARERKRHDRTRRLQAYCRSSREIWAAILAAEQDTAWRLGKNSAPHNFSEQRHGQGRFCLSNDPLWRGSMDCFDRRQSTAPPSCGSQSSGTPLRENQTISQICVSYLHVLPYAYFWKAFLA